jgi:hypothetical protein
MAAPMRATLAFVLSLSVQPALACHHYRSWSYPWPQSCKATSAPARPHRTWFAEVKPEPTPAPAVSEPGDPERVRAIDALKQELRLRLVRTLELQTIGLTQEEKHNGD